LFSPAPAATTAAAAAAAAAAATAAAALDQATGSVDRLRSTLDEQLRRVQLGPDQPPDTLLTVLDAALAARTERESAVERSSVALAEARSAAGAATERLAALTAEAGQVRVGLRRARDPLVPLGVPDPDDDDPAAGWAAVARWARAERQARAARADQARAELAGRTAEVARATAAGTALAGELAALRQRHTAAVREAEAAAGELDRRQHRITELTARLAGAPTDDQARTGLDRLDRLAAAASAADAGLAAARTELAAVSARLQQLTPREQAGWTALRAARDPLVPLGAPDVLADPGGGLLAAWTGLSGWAAEGATARAAAVVAASGRVTEVEAVHTELAKSIIESLGALDVPLVQGDVAVNAAAALAAALERARADTRRITERRRRAATLRSERAQAETDEQVARMLGGLMHSTRFPRWLAGAALDVLVADASQSLRELSAGQFELTHSAGEFFVVDHADADSRRSVRTLSGGETFQASLALALALSAQMSTLAAGGAARLDSIFLDEGFGTLDPETLEVVAATLENLAHGERMVGVITHVAALADRVPVRFRVQRDGLTSTIVREG